jgi:arylsulfatase A-like enzyme
VIRLRLPAGLALVVLAAACAPPPLPDHSVPLVSLAAAARPVVETDAIDIGEPAARPTLWSGWGPDERTEEMSFVWGSGGESRILVHAVEPRTRELRLRGWSYPFGDDPPQRVTILLNGREAGSRDLNPRPGSLRMPLRAALWRVGENVLELRHERVRRVAGEPPWSAGWDGLRLDDGRATEEMPRFAADGTLVLPARTAFEWTLELPGDAWLAWDEVVVGESARLALRQRDENGWRELAPSRRAPRARLTAVGEARHLVGFALAAVGARGAVRVAHPRIHLPAPAVGPAAAATPPAPPATPPNLVVYLVDTLRADRLGCYGYPRPTSPEFDRLAVDGVLWREGRAQSSWTRPAVATVLTGLLPVTHRAQETRDRLPAEVTTLAERFAAAGWQTAMLTTNGNVAARFGFNQGWDDFIYLRERRTSRPHHVQSAEANESLFRWLDRRDPARPFLLFVHTTDPHDPYTPPERFRALLAGDVEDAEAGTARRMRQLATMSDGEALAAREALSRLYDAEIAANDASFGRLRAALERRGLASTTAVLLLSDHGEEFFEHGGWTHGRTLYEEQLRIPFVLALPGGAHAGRVLPGPAEQIDVVPTLLALAGLPADPTLPGRNLLADLASDAPRPGERQSLAWLARNGISLASIVRVQWKLVRNDALGGFWNRPPHELYGLSSDAGERDNLALADPLRRAWLDGLLAAAVSRHASDLAAEPVELDPEIEANLRALGYL